MKRVKDDLDRLTEKLLKADPSLQVEFDKADQAWDIAFQIYDLRKKAGLTQKQLAEFIGTNLEKVTKALKAKLEVRIVPASHREVVHLHRIK